MGASGAERVGSWASARATCSSRVPAKREGSWAGSGFVVLAVELGSSGKSSDAAPVLRACFVLAVRERFAGADESGVLSTFGEIFAVANDFACGPVFAGGFVFGDDGDGGFCTVVADTELAAERFAAALGAVALDFGVAGVARVGLFDEGVKEVGVGEAIGADLARVWVKRGFGVGFLVWFLVTRLHLRLLAGVRRWRGAWLAASEWIHQ